MSRLTRHPGQIAWLTVVWVGLWGSVTPANVLGGLAIAVLLALCLPLTETAATGVVRPWSLLRFVAQFTVDLVRASVQVALLVLRPRPVLHPAVLVVPVRGASDRLLTLVANAISLTPGTLTLEVDRERSLLYVHVLDVGKGPHAVERVRADILRVERLAVLAVGSDEGRRAMEEEMQDITEVPQ